MTRPGKPEPKVEEDFGEKVKAHQRYKLADGTQVPGATTVLGVLDKAGLVGWANKLGLQGIDSRKFKDEAAAVGTLAHYLVERELDGQPADLSDYTQNQIERAMHSVMAFRKWLDGRTIEPILVEGRLVSEKYRYGGKVDFFGLLAGRRALLDFKTSKAIYPEHKAQTASYVKLLIENGHKPQEAHVVKLGRGPGASVEDHLLGREELKAHWALFDAAHGVYRALKVIRAL
jgi:hypothetical protein